MPFSFRISKNIADQRYSTKVKVVSYSQKESTSVTIINEFILSISYSKFVQRYEDLKHRSKEEISALILEAIVNTNRATQTIIMYKAYLTHAQLKEFLSSLVEKGLIEYQKEDRLYTITDKGVYFLQVYNQLNQLQLNNVLNTTPELEIVESPQRRNGQQRHVITYDEQNASTNHRRTCEKCLRLFANHKELKLHKIEYHSY